MDGDSEVNSVIIDNIISLFRRVDDSLEFYNNTWNEYKNGFDNGLLNNVWLGNDRINVLTNINDVILRIEIFGDRIPNSPNPNISLYGEYNFSVKDNDFY